MILQSIILPDNRCPNKEIFYHGTADIETKDDCMIIPPNQLISFFSYMNMFDTDAWHKYTTLSAIRFCVDIKGSGILLVKSKIAEKEQILDEHHFSGNNWMAYSYDLTLNQNLGCCYFEVSAESEIQLKNARFETTETTLAGNDVQIALNICTYHRNEEVQRNIKQITESRFFQSHDELFQKLYVITVDNGEELEERNEAHVKLVHNPNTGGSGGFKRGLEEIRKWDKTITHVVFMDDDIEFYNETLYRLHALLSFMKEECTHESVAGRMFRTDTRHIQYTAAEIWNKGDLRHIGLNADMTLENEILDSNINKGAEYGGWWFCCYPMSFARDNDPLPFFIHCDDVEYGLRHGGTPIILNGIQVWHETYEYRQSPVMAYYDMRNLLVVNAMYNFGMTTEKLYEWWKSKITEQHVKNDYQTEYMMILGMLDFLRGKKYFQDHNSVHKHNSLIHYRKNTKEINSILWRFTRVVLKYRYKKITEAYRVYRKGNKK